MEKEFIQDIQVILENYFNDLRKFKLPPTKDSHERNAVLDVAWRNYKSRKYHKKKIYKNYTNRNL